MFRTMDELLDMVVNDASPAEVSDKIKDILYTKSSEKIEGLRPEINTTFVNGVESEDSDDVGEE